MQILENTPSGCPVLLVKIHRQPLHHLRIILDINYRGFELGELRVVGLVERELGRGQFADDRFGSS